MPSVSKQQQKFFGVVKAMQKGDIPKKGSAGKVAKTMDKDDVDDFASTKHKGLPKKVKREMKVRELIKKLVREIMSEASGQYKVSPKVQMNWGMDKVVIISGNKRVVLTRKEMKSLMKGVKANKLTEGTCGYGINGELGEEPAGPHLIKKKEIEEGKDTIFDVAKKVMKDKQHQNYKSKKGMVKLDMQTANLLTQVFKKINPKMKKILSDLGEKNPAQLVATLQAVVK